MSRLPGRQDICRFPRSRAGMPDTNIGFSGHRGCGLPCAGAMSRVLPTPARRWLCQDLCMPATVLLVDDDPDFRQLARTMLTGAGLVVVADAATVAAAIVAARDHRPDSALVDVGLPDG